MDDAARERGFALHREAQRRAWLASCHRERLDWLEQAKAFAARATGAAQGPGRRRAARPRPKPAPD